MQSKNLDTPIKKKLVKKVSLTKTIDPINKKKSIKKVLPSDEPLDTDKLSKTSKQVVKTSTKKTSKPSKTVVSTTTKTDELKTDESTTKKVELKTSKTDESKTDESTTKKVKKVKVFNTKQLNSERTGLNISPAKIKNILSNNIINKEIFKAVNELKSLEQNNKSIDDISPETKKLLNDITEEDKFVKMRQFSKKKYESFTDDEKVKYNTFKLSESKLQNNCVFENATHSDFNLKFDTNFYKDFSYKLSESTDIASAIQSISKKKYRFSNNSRLYISAFVELLIQQMSYNSIYTCVENKKKIIQVEFNNVKNINLESSDYELYNLISNLDVYNLFKDETKNTEDFVISNLTKDKQYQFKYYVSEICRDVKQQLTNKYNDLENVYNSTSISKQFKNYCSLIICEVLNVLGKMIKIEVDSRSVKTINDTVIKTVLEQLYAANGIDFTKTSEFIINTHAKYNNYKQTKKTVKTVKTVG